MKSLLPDLFGSPLIILMLCTLILRLFEVIQTYVDFSSHNLVTGDHISSFASMF